jgi:hypothetical protein
METMLNTEPFPSGVDGLGGRGRTWEDEKSSLRTSLGRPQ